jgi:hypothetical protein
MTEKREVIRRLRLGHSIRHINKSTGMHRTLIRRLKDLAQQHLWLESEEPVPDEATIKALLDPPASSSNAEHPLDPYRSDIAKWLKEEYSYVVIHQLLSPMVPVLPGNGNLNYPGCGKQNSPTRMKKKSSSYKVVDTTPTTRMNSNDTYECISNHTETQEAGHGNSGNQPPAGNSP